MTGINRSLERVTITLRDRCHHTRHDIHIDVFDNSLSRRWLEALTYAIQHNLHLEKNYCFLGFPVSERDGAYLCDKINHSISAINRANLGYNINDCFVVDDLVPPGPAGPGLPGLRLNHDRLNRLHRYFEDLQGMSGAMSRFYQCADAETRWHIRQLNLLCHEFETWALSWRKYHSAPEWVRPSQLMCWLAAPRFQLQHSDLELFGIDSLYRDLGGVYVGVNKAIGKHHWEVFQGEGRDSRLDELTTTSMRGQTEAAADFDIEWAQNTRGHPWMAQQLTDFRSWLLANGFDTDDPALTIGHPKVAQVDLDHSFGTSAHVAIWELLEKHMDVYSVSVAGVTAFYDYHWQDHNYMQQQITALEAH
jgi:hypothetical protein